MSFEFKATGVDVCRELAFNGLTKTDERRVRTGGVFGDLILFDSFCVVLMGDDAVNGGDFGLYIICNFIFTYIRIKNVFKEWKLKVSIVFCVKVSHNF